MKDNWKCWIAQSSKLMVNSV